MPLVQRWANLDLRHTVKTTLGRISARDNTNGDWQRVLPFGVRSSTRQFVQPERPRLCGDHMSVKCSKMASVMVGLWPPRKVIVWAPAKYSNTASVIVY
jgi:hypothetical protein